MPLSSARLMVSSSSSTARLSWPASARQIARWVAARYCPAASARSNALVTCSTCPAKEACQATSTTTESLGAAHERTLSARFEVAVWTWRLDGPAAAARIFCELLEYAESLESVPWSFIIDCGWNLGGALTDAGNANAALPILEATIEESQRAYGPEHRHTLNVRLTHVQAVGSAGEPKKAAKLAARLVEDSGRVLGEAYLTTLQARYAVAGWTAESGNEETARQLFETLHAETARLFGDDHWLVVEVGTRLKQA